MSKQQSAPRRGRLALRRWRQAQNPEISAPSLGEQVGCSGDYIRHFEAGRRPFPLWLAVRVSRVTEIPLRDLLARALYRSTLEAAELIERDRAEAA